MHEHLLSDAYSSLYYPSPLAFSLFIFLPSCLFLLFILIILVSCDSFFLPLSILIISLLLFVRLQFRLYVNYHHFLLLSYSLLIISPSYLCTLVFINLVSPFTAIIVPFYYYSGLHFKLLLLVFTHQESGACVQVACILFRICMFIRLRILAAVRLGPSHTVPFISFLS